MSVKVEVRSVIHREGNKNGKQWAMDIASCIVQNADGTEGMGEMILPKGHPKVDKGFHDVELRAYASSGSIVFGIQSMIPVARK